MQPNMDYARNCSELPGHLKTLFTNPTYIMLTLFVCCDSFIIEGFANFGPKYLENQFSQSASLSGALFGEFLNFHMVKLNQTFPLKLVKKGIACHLGSLSIKPLKK